MKYHKLIRPEVKDEYGLLHLQEVILNIMQYIDDFCKSNDIEYYIIGEAYAKTLPLASLFPSKNGLFSSFTYRLLETDPAETL